MYSSYEAILKLDNRNFKIDNLDDQPSVKVLANQLSTLSQEFEPIVYPDLTHKYYGETMEKKNKQKYPIQHE
jgi:hypothetical protein